MSDDGDDLPDERPEWLDELKDELAEEDQLESTPPSEGYDLWLQSHEDKSDSTLQSYRYRLRPFMGFMEEKRITDLNDLQTRDVKEFEIQRTNQDLKQQTLNNQFGTIQRFLAFCHDLDAVREDVVYALDVPSLSKDEKVNTEKIVADRAQEILANLDKLEYASRRHVMFLLLWRTTVRIGALHGLDIQDFYYDQEDLAPLRDELVADGFAMQTVNGILEDVETPFIYPRNRATTPLKTRQMGERVINITEETAEVVQTYIDVKRANVTDDEGRNPLLTSQKGDGRLSKSAIRNWCYLLTQPCEFGAACPHDQDPETCQAREHGHGSKCPSSRSPHRIRTGSITHHLDQGWSVAAVAAKAATSEELVRGVYDQPEQLIRGALRRQHLDKLEED